MNLYRKNMRYRICALADSLHLYSLSPSINPPLRVLILHSVHNQEKLSSLITHLRKNWNFITPNHFFNILDNQDNIDTPSLLITFDDGFKDNLAVIDTLEKYSISALFFVCPGLVELASSKLLFPLLIKKFFRLSSINEEMLLLNWDDLRNLQNLGHSIGHHSSFHFQLNRLSEIELSEDINLSKSLFSKNLIYNRSFNSYSFPFGGAEHINYSSLKLLSNNFKYIFSGIRGNINYHSKSSIIFRDSVALEDPYPLTDSLLRGNFDLYYKFRAFLLRIGL
tara:strand:- start:7686 stop:8525 length:840 start_codon:yes stop_codon:yes gene_type:complete